MPPRRVERLTFLEAFFGLILEPRTTIAILFEDESPRHGLSFIIVLLITIFGPVLTQTSKYGDPFETIPAVYALALLMLITIIVFLLLESWFFMLMGIDCNSWSLFSAIGYCCAPLVVVVIFIYGFNYISSGYLSLLRVLVTGQWGYATKFVKVLPLALCIAQVSIVVLFYYSIKRVGELHTLSALCLTLFSLVPFYIAFTLGLLVAQLVHPGILQVVGQAMNVPESLRIILSP